MDIQITVATSPDEVAQILELQRQNLRYFISTEKAATDGFVTVAHTPKMMSQMASKTPQIIAKEGDSVVAYALVMPEFFKDLVPVLQPLFKRLEDLTFRQKKITDYRYYVMGQICVAEGYRGIGLFDQLYAKHKEICGKYFELCVTEISAHNLRSARAHARVGFQKIDTYKDETDDWDVVVLPM